jgi:alpha-tubulin suppressor-like RCC1 family protein
VKKSSSDSVTPLTSVSVFFGGPGNGSVTGSPGLISSEGATITLTATPDATSLLAGWGGSCSGTSATCTVTLAASNNVIAYFRSKFKTVAAGAYHTCALRPAGDVVCWGYNAEGEIGTGTLNTAPLAPSPVIGITTAVAIAAGGYHTCALLVGGTVSCWGKGNDGQLGDPMHFPMSNATPMTVPGISEALAVTAGGAHTCVVLAGGSASCWGLNGDGQLGASSTPSYHTPTPVTWSAAAGPLTKQIAAGAYHTCAIVGADSTVTCWGLNGDGQAPRRVLISDPGVPAVGCIIPPGGGDCVSAVEGAADYTPVIYLNKVTTIAASIGVGALVGGGPLGGYHTVALDSSGNDWGWGNNSEGQLPDGAGGGYAMMDPSPPPVPAPVKIAAGAYHTCILDCAKGVFCRGNNNDQQSGPSPPGFVSGTTSAVDVAAGGYHTCAVFVNVLAGTPAAGSVACWGLNWNGEVDGTFHGSDVKTPLVLTVP